MGPPVLLGTPKEFGEQGNRLGAESVMQNDQDTARPPSGAAMIRRGGGAGTRDPAKVTQKLETEGEPVHVCLEHTSTHSQQG